jgi:hypothetical protein
MNPNQQPEQNPVVPPAPTATPPPTVTPQAPIPSPTGQPPRPEHVGNQMKSLTGWKKALGILFLIGFALVFLAVGGWFFLPIILPVGIWYVWQYKKQQSLIKAYAAKHGYVYQANAVLNDLDGVIFQNPAHFMGQGSGPSNGYLLGWLVHGQISGRNFRMYEYTLDDRNGSGVNTMDGVGIGVQINRQATSFDVMDIVVQGEGLQFLLISNTRKTILNHIRISLKQYQLEGDFNRYFTLYGAEGAEIEVLRIFTPDVMAYLIDHYQTYSLELTPQHFFIYRDSSSLSQIEGNCESLVAAATDLSTKFFSGVERVHYAENAVVPASVQAASDQTRIAGGFPIWAAVLMSIVVCVFGIFAVRLISGDHKIPAGYVQATDAKVSEDNPIVCRQPSTKYNSCSTTYQIKATFTAQNGQPYWYQDTLPANHPVGSSITLYYNPSNPSQADFVGEHSTKGAIPIVIVFLGFCLLFVWGLYFSKRRP